jgi:hypothetical protein
MRGAENLSQARRCVRYQAWWLHEQPGEVIGLYGSCEEKQSKGADGTL